MPIGSTRIVAQQLAHIPTSKRSEVLLMKKMGVLPPSAPVSSVAKRSYDGIFTGKLTTSQVAALDELFPVSKCKSGRAARRALVEAI
jgi:hypothetical protein